jgi:two-component system sensor histidine kinase QseC
MKSMAGTPLSLQGRLLALVLGLVLSVWLATAALTWSDARHELDELLDSHLAQAAALLVVQQTPEVHGSDDVPGLDAPSLHHYAPKVAFQVFDDARLVLRSANAPLAPMVGAGAKVTSGFATVAINGVEWRVFAASASDHDGDVQVYVGEQANSRDAILWAVLRGTLWPMLVALPLLALAAWWAVYRGVEPIRRLAQTLAEREPQALNPVVVDGATSEMQPMVGALNGLFERIKGLLEGERRFTADAAHELRTPIAGIRAQAQVALAETDDRQRRHALQATLDGCDRATRLVDQLLTLSRLDAAAAPEMTRVDFAALVRSAVGELALRALAKQQTLEFDGLEAGETAPVRGNEVLLAVLLRNLIDNAVRYSPALASVHVSLRREKDGPGDGDGARLVLSVEDSGPGLGDAERQRLGERFFRVAGSSESGSGLGWSIVRRIAAVHRLRLEVGRSTALGGLAVRVSAG